MSKGVKIIVGIVALIVAVILGMMVVKSINTHYLWYLARASGIGSYIMLFMLMMSGLGITTGFIYNFMGPVFSWRLHRAYGITLVAFVLMHIVALGFDTTMNFSLADLFVPFYSQFKPNYLSLGIVGFWLLVLIIVTSLIWVVKKYKAWRLVHYLVFPAFVTLFLHGVLIGTDRTNRVMIVMYWTTGILVFAGVIYRIRKVLEASSS